MDNLLDIPSGLVNALRDADHVVVLTGAGVSAPSGIPTFRDALTGLWARYDPTQLSSIDAFEADPALVTRWHDERRVGILRLKPNPAHTALVEIENHLQSNGRRFTLLTQNVDRLHQRAGSRKVHELHGSLIAWRCTTTGQEQEYNDPQPFDDYPPRSSAGGLLRPAIVWFGEMLPPDTMRVADEASRQCDLFISIGTSGVVYPAAGLIEIAAGLGARTCEINLQPTPMSGRVDWSVQASCDLALPELSKALIGPIVRDGDGSRR